MKQIYKIIRNLFCVLALGIMVTMFVECESKNNPISDLEELVQDLQENSKNYTEDDWAAATESLEHINTNIEKYRSQYTDEEKKEIGRLYGICGVYFARNAAKSFSNDLRDAILQLQGCFSGIKEVLDGNNDFNGSEKLLDGDDDTSEDGNIF